MIQLKSSLINCILLWILSSYSAIALGAAMEESAPTAPVNPAFSQHLLSDMQREIDKVQPWLERYGYGAVFGAVGVEGFGIPAPGQTLLIASAVTAATEAAFDIRLLLLAAFIAAVLGSSIGYYIGHKGGRTLLQRLRVNEQRLERMEQRFKRYGGGLIVFGRFFDGIRQINSVAAGILKMSWWKFTAYNVLGAALWVGCWGLGVYFLDEHWESIFSFLRHLNPWIAAGTLLVVAASLGLLWYTRNGSNHQQSL